MPFSFKFAYNICYLFREIVFSSLIFLVLLMIVIFINNVASQEPVPCAPRKISCFFCNSSKLKGCEDPFPKRDMYLPNLPTVDCYEDCFKWLYIDFQQKHQLIRGCSSQLYLKIDRHLICMHESKGRGGYICFCSSEKCNHTQGWPKALSKWTLVSLIIPVLLFNRSFSL